MFTSKSKQQNECGDSLASPEKGIIIEEYLDDKPFPSYLICGKSNNKFVHVLLSDDGENSYLITTYIPDKELWNEDFTKRR